MKNDVTNALIKKADQVSRGAELLLSTISDWQIIKQYLCNRLEDFELSAKQQKKLERYQYIYNQLVSGKYTDNEVVQQIMKIYSIKQTQAYEDINCTREIFNHVININKHFELNLQLQINRNMLRKAEEMNDIKGYAALEKNRALLLKQLPEADDNPAELFEGHSIEAVFDPRLLGAPDVDMEALLKIINEKRNVKIKTDLFTDIAYEDLKNDTP